MVSPYKSVFREHEGGEVTLNRAGAQDVTGEVMKGKIGDNGCVIGVREGQEPETIMLVFVAYDDIRGVGVVSHDYANIA